MHGFHALVPIRHGDRDAVGLGGRGELAARTLPSELESVLENAVDPGARHHGFLHHRLAGRALEDLAADARILALGILAYHVEVDLAGLAVGQRALDAGHQLAGAQIDVLVELAPELQQRAPQRHVIGNLLGHADGAEEDGIEPGERGLPVIRQHLAVLEIVVAAGEVEVFEGEIDVEAFGRGLQGANAFRRDFGADAVTGNDGDAVSLAGCLVVGHGWLTS